MPGSQSTPFNVNEMFDEATYFYACLTDEAGAWYIKRVNQDGTGVGHATELNNPTVTNYVDAATGRAALTYGRFDEAF